MILTCPQCSTRYQVDASKFPAAGRNIRCAKCGNVWHQAPPQPEPEPDLAIIEPDPPPPQPEPPKAPAPQPMAFAPAAEPVVRPAPAPVRAPVFLDREPGPSWGSRLSTIAGWGGLVVVVFLVGWLVISFRRDVATLWPQSASLYKAVGLTVNASGIQFIGVTNRLEIQDGAHVLVVSGKLVNSSHRELPVPQIRVSLTDAQKRELYHWPVTPDAPTLKPGQSVPFLTRLANPPASVHDVEVTFARPDE
jgi:predicted Zn finger-like uncharacterized protein